MVIELVTKEFAILRRGHRSESTSLRSTSSVNTGCARAAWRPPRRDTRRHCEHPIEAGDRGYIRTVMVDEMNFRLAPARRGCDYAVVAGNAEGVCTCSGFATIWDRNVELERRGIFTLADRIAARRNN